MDLAHHSPRTDPKVTTLQTVQSTSLFFPIDFENDTSFSSFVRTRIRFTSERGLRLRLSNPIHDGPSTSELTFLFLTGHWPSDLFSRF